MKYEDVYAFKVLDEIRAGNKIYLLDKSRAENSNAVVIVNDMRIEALLKVIDDPDRDNRYAFFKCVIFEENKEGVEE